MNRDEEPVLDPFYNYYGMWRRPARRSIPPLALAPSNNPSLPTTEEEDPIEEESDSYKAQLNESESTNHSEPVPPWSPDHSELFPYDPNYENTDPTTPSHYYSESEPFYHPASGNSEPDLNLYDLVIEDQIDPGSPTSTHTSVGDNFNYPEIQLLDDEVAEPDDYHYVLDDDTPLIIRFEHYLAEVENYAHDTQSKYLMFLSLIGNYQANCDQHAPAAWIRSTLYFFPCTRFWARIINELLDDGPILGVRIHLRYLKCLVRLYM